MAIPPKLRKIREIIFNFKGGIPASQDISEEMNAIENTFNINSPIEPIWRDKDFSINKPESSNENYNNINFNAFIDGVQRSAIVYWITLKNSGVIIPIIMGHIGAGITIRRNKKLVVNNEFVKDRILLLLPLEGMIREGLDIKNTVKEWEESGLIIRETKIMENPTEGFENDDDPPIILCDTTFTKIYRTEAEEKERIENAFNDIAEGKYTPLLIGDNLYDINKIKSRAQGRINVLRQILEMYVLYKYRMDNRMNNHNDYILVDGPLYFIGKWLKNGNMGDFEKESSILKNCVGFVKSLKGKPKDVNLLQKILYLKDSEYTDPMYFEDVIDIYGKENELDHFKKPHITTFLRFNIPKDFSVPSSLGLVRIDLHLSTLDADNLEYIKYYKDKTKNIMDKIINAVRRERFPGVIQIGRSFSEPYPIKETEIMLHSRLYSTLEMKYLYYLLKK
jgi:hypothetical protein